MERALKEIPFDGPTLSVIEGLAGAMMFIAILHGIGGALCLVGALGLMCAGGIGAASGLDDGSMMLFAVLGIVGTAIYAIVGAVLLYQAKLLFDARSNLMNVVSSDDADQQFTAQALSNLKRFFLIEAICAVLIILGSLLSLFQSIVA